MKKEDLHRRIMEGLKGEIFNALNEEFQFDDTEVADKLLEIVRKDKQIQKVVAGATKDDWSNVLRGMVKLIKSKNIPENPAKIANIVQLATAILQRGIDSKLQEKMAEMTFDDIQYTSDFLVKEVAKFAKPADKQNGGKQSQQDNNNNGQLVDSEQTKKENEGKGCNEKEKGNEKENKPVSEARNYKRQGGFSRFLNENNIRPGRGKRRV